MRYLTHFSVVFTMAANLLAAPVAHAGRSCENSKPTTLAVERGLTLAERTIAALDASGHDVVLLARAGQDLTRYGVHYSHLGFAYRQPDGSGGHVWRVLHKLNQCGTDVSAIHRQGLGDFFLDDLWRYEAAFVAPVRDVQDRLLPILRDDRLATRLHRTPYSIVSYAWGGNYQQSNQWAIETLAAAMLPPDATRSQAQSWLQAQAYEPGLVRLGALSRLGGMISAPNVAFDDHPAEKRFSGRIETVTVDSVFAWLRKSKLGGAPVLVELKN